MRFAFYTLGCKTNQYETQAMERLLLEKGHEIGSFDEACDGYVAVYGGRGGGKPMMTDIELSALASADRAMIELGIPVKNREELLLLLEDLGS